MKKSIFSRLTLVVATLFLCLSAYAQEKVSVSGTVTDQSGQPVVGAAIFEKGTSNGVTTDIDGKYTIAVKKGATLAFSCIGYAESSQKVTDAGTINVILADDSTLLEETVVIGYGVQKKSDVTGAIASIGTETLQNRSVNDAAAAIAGKTSGVQVISGSGQPGSIGTIRIRGISSNNGSASNPLYIVDGLQVGSLQSIDPNNIESMEILKDAASAAIYGAQAGNGVVLVTTKTGKKGEGKVFYNGSYTIERLGKHPDMLNAQQYIDYMTNGSVFTQTLVDEYWDGKTDTDWFKEALPGGFAERNTVGVQGGNDKGTFYAAISRIRHNGILYGDLDTFRRTTFALNADYRIKKWLQVGTTNNFNIRRMRAMGSVNGGDSSITGKIYSLDPLTPMFYTDENAPENVQSAIAQGLPVARTPDGKIISTSEFVSRTANPLFDLYRYKTSTRKSQGIDGTLFAVFTPFKGFAFTSRLGYTFSSYDNFTYSEPYWLSGTQNSTQYSLEDKVGTTLKYQWENFANYHITIAKKHNLDAMAGMSYIESNSWYVQGTTNELDDYSPNFQYLTFSKKDASNDTVSGNPGRTANLSYFGRLGYNYANRYFLQASFRADAFDSSYLAVSNRWGYFPSLSLGWTISNEPWMQGVSKDVLSFLKARSSFGTNGNIAALGSGYVYDATVSKGSNYQMDNTGNVTLATFPNKLSNPALRWETSKQFDLGIDARFLSDRLSFSIDYYNKDTDDLLVKVIPSYTTGQTVAYVNSGSVNNNGIEIELSWKDQIGDFSYGISGNISHNNNKATYLDKAITRINGYRVSNNHEATVFEEGYPVWYMRGWVFDGVNPETGETRIKDLDGNEKINDDDQTMIGNAQPDFLYGLTLNAEYKGFDLTIFGSGSQGNDIWFGMLRSDCADRNVPSVFYTDAWKKAGDKTRYPKYGNVVSSQYYRSSACIYDGSYFRINQIQLGYTFPKSLLEKVKVSNLRIYASLDDFFTFSKYIGFDPVTASVNTGSGMGFDVGNYPSAKKAVFGVNLSF